MKEILIFGGTTEGRKLSEILIRAGIYHTLCVATEYGEIVLKKHPLVKVHKGRMDREEILDYIKKGEFGAVVDATHPYAAVVTENIKAAIRDTDIPYLRLKRETMLESGYGKIHYFEDSAACARALEKVEGNILLTTGSKELAVFCKQKEIREKLYVRVLPGVESLKICMDCGIAGKQILALQGPFTTEMNTAMIHQYKAACLVTKESGKNGGYREKLEAAEKAGIPVYVVGGVKEEEGDCLEKICRELEEICKRKITATTGFEIVLAGIGMGKMENLTGEVQKAIREADIILGAERMIENYQPKLEKRPYYKAPQIISYLEELQKSMCGEAGRKVVILFSGDSGFYSGCQSLYGTLQAEIEAGRLHAVLSVLPGISSVAYLAACMGESYQDAAIYSMHGKQLFNPAGKLRQEKKTFLLLSGLEDMHKLGKLLGKEGLEHCTVTAGYQLSYPEQQIRELTWEECLKLEGEGLYTCCIKNPMPEKKKLTAGIPDTEFIRDKVPMTKEEVREVSICKLRPDKNAVVYDIGSGTGSIAVELAGLSDTVRVFAIEKEEAAALLIKRNKEKFHLENIEIIEGKAPEALNGLPKPTHAFIGGSGGKMKEILSALYQLNPKMRMVINAVSMETICEIKEVLSLFPVQEEEIVQLQVSRARKAGAYHIMQAENPVWICAFTFEGK